MAGLREEKKRNPAAVFSRSCDLDLDLDPTRAGERAKRLGLAEFQDRGASAKSESARHESARGETDRSDPLGGYREPARRSTKVPPKSRLRSTTMERYRMSSIRRLSFSFYPLFTFADEQVLFFFMDRAKLNNGSSRSLDPCVSISSLLLLLLLFDRFSLLFLRN